MAYRAGSSAPGAGATVSELAKIFKAYDIRGVVPDELDETVAEAVGAAFARGATAQGADVVAGGLGSTDMLYYASGSRGIPGAMITASHNPPKYNGIKLCRDGARPVGRDTGLTELRDMVARGVPRRDGAVPSTGTITSQDLLSGYASHLKTLVDLSGIRPLKVAFDADADRCFVVDERGEIVPPSVLTALIAVRELAREPGAVIIHNLITSRAVPEIVSEHGGRPVRTRVGHSFIKAEMARTGAVFGGEHSGHFYFRDFWFADSGMLAALHVLCAPGTQDRPLSQLLARSARYKASGEINSEVADQQAATERVRDAFAGRATIDELDGLTVMTSDWWFNLRPSNTEPVLRLNVEAAADATLAAVRDEVLGIIRDAPAP